MSTPLVSVVIPTYNSARFIVEAVASALDQTYGNLEVIVVDDGSTDDTRQRLGAFADRITYIPQSNTGEWTARNAGIWHSRGEYVAFLDADDVWLPHKLERCIAVFAEDPTAAVAYSWRSCIDETGSPLPQVFASTHEGNVLEQLLLGCFLVPSTVVVRRACLDRVGVFESAGNGATDYDFFVRVAREGYRFRCVREPLVRYRLHSTSQSSNAAKHCQAGRVILDRAFSWPNLPPELRDASFRMCAYRRLLINGSSYCLCYGRWEEACALLAEGIGFEPTVLTRSGFYVGLAMSVVPVGYQTRSELLARIDIVAATLCNLLRAVFASPRLPPEVAARERAAWGALYLALTALYGLSGRWVDAASWLGRSFTVQPIAAATALGRGMRGHWSAVRTTLRI